MFSYTSFLIYQLCLVPEHSSSFRHSFSAMAMPSKGFMLKTGVSFSESRIKIEREVFMWKCLVKVRGDVLPGNNLFMVF
jgi:hypothetical protein